MNQRDEIHTIDMKPFTLALLLFLTCSFAFSQGEVSFFEGSFDELKAKAQAENKPFFVSFHAQWSIPCQNMNKYTYSNASLVDYVKTNYLAKKVDAESVDDGGMELAAQFGVSLFPTIVIFNPKGEKVDQFTRFVTGPDLVSELKKHEVKQIASSNTSNTSNTPNTSNNSNTSSNNTSTSDKDNNSNNSSTASNNNTTPPKKTTTSTPVVKPKPVKEEPVTVPATTFPSIKGQQASTATRSASSASSGSANAKLAPVVSKSGLYRISMSDQANQGTGVQTGVYGNYENVLKEVAFLEKTYKQNVLVNIAEIGGKTVFKVIVGPFGTKGQADGFQKIFQQREKRKTMIVNLESFD